MKYAILLTLLAAQTAMACDPVQAIKKGQPSNCDGFVFSIPKELEVRQGVIELDYTKQILVEKDKLISLKDMQATLLTDQSNLWKTQAQDLSKQLVNQENNRLWWFFGGVLAATAMAFAVSRVTR